MIIRICAAVIGEASENKILGGSIINAEQLSRLVSEVRETGNGFFTDFEKDDALKIDAEGKSFRLHNLSGEINRN